MKVYRVISFDPGISERQANKAGADAIAKRLQDAIDTMARSGWDYERYEAIVTTVNSGCLGIFSGQRTVHYGTLVFSREATNQTTRN